VGPRADPSRHPRRNVAGRRDDRHVRGKGNGRRLRVGGDDQEDAGARRERGSAEAA
jgi:hypothetical protein